MDFWKPTVPQYRETVIFSTPGPVDDCFKRSFHEQLDLTGQTEQTDAVNPSLVVDILSY